MNRTFAVKVPGTLGRMSPEALSELIETIAHDLVAAGKAGTLTDDLIPETAKFAVMRPKDRAHGDWAGRRGDDGAASPDSCQPEGRVLC